MKKKIINFLKKNSKWIILICMILIFIELIENIFANEIYYFDTIVYSSIIPFIQEPITSILKVLTHLGSAAIVVSICVITFAIFKNKNYGKYITLNLLIITILNQLMKHIFQRPRPTEYRIINESGYSFPSGHSMVSMAFYGFLIYLVYKNVENKTVKWILCTVLASMIVLIGLSRIYLGVHYASDVIGGFCFSIAYLILYTNIIGKKVKTMEKGEEK